MAIDPLSPIAPARVRALVLPVGRIKRSRFLAFLDLLTPACEVRLGKLRQDERLGKTPFSPLDFPNGVVLYDLALSSPPASHLSLSPFELFREPLIVLGIADAREYSSEDEHLSGHDARAKEFLAVADSLRTQFSRVLLHRVLLFDNPGLEAESKVQDELILVPSEEKMKPTTMNSIACDLTASLLAELTSFAKSIHLLPSIASPTVTQSSGTHAHWHGDERPILSRTGSNSTDRSRSASPAIDPRDTNRMSMPVLPSSLSNVTLDSGIRADSPNGSQPPAKTFEEIAGHEPSLTGISGGAGNRPRPGSMALSRDTSRDRVSIHGFGSDSFTEKTRNKGRGRVGVVLGSIYLQAGQWERALGELVGGGMKARSFSDHIWHAKALENIMICMIMLAWSGFEFKIPQICYPGADLVSSPKSSHASEAEGLPDLEIHPCNAAAKSSLLKMLSSLMPVLTNMILSIYARAATHSGEPIPQLAFSECTIRFCKLLAAINVAGGALTDDVLSHLIRGTPWKVSANLSLPRIRVLPTRKEIAGMLSRGFPGPLDQSGLSSVDNIMILAGIASVFSALGMQRKKAIVIKDFLAALIPSILQAKMVGAAEAGVHPSAGITALARTRDLMSGDNERGLEDFLNLLCQVYGIPESNLSQSIGSDAAHDDEAPNGNTTSKVATHLPKQLIGNFVLRFFGSVNIKSDVLRACIHLCEVMPDYHGVLHYTSALLRTAGPGIAPSAETSDVLVTLSREEQIQLANSITKTVADAKAAGFDNIEAEYWDEFLVRGCILIEPSTSLMLRPHRRSDLGKVKALLTEKRDPFIHNPFLDKSSTKTLFDLLVAGEEREFVVALQNPYDFEVDIESLGLFVEGNDVVISKHDLVLKPYRTQSFSISGVIIGRGPIFINGCTIKIKGCKERLFPIFSEPWSPAGDFKIKNIGLLKPTPPDSRHASDRSASPSGQEEWERLFPIPAAIPLFVIPQQPVLIVSKTSLPQNALMLLEGERKIISVTLHNTSDSVSADFLHISLHDSLSSVMQEALSQKGVAPADMYEIEYQLANHSPIRQHIKQPTSIAPRSSEVFQFEVLGKPGLSSAVIQIDYANLSIPHTENEDSCYTRQVTVPLSITVNSSIQVLYLDVKPLSGDFDWLKEKPNGAMHDSTRPTDEHTSRLHSVFSSLSADTSYEELCLVLLDLRNSWPSPLRCGFQVQPVPSHLTQDSTSRSSDKPISNPSPLFVSDDLIQPGHVSRQVLLVPKIYLSHPHQRIKPISPAHERQFVVSTERISHEAERASRESFWFREALLSLISGTWVQDDDGFQGNGMIDLRGCRLSSRMVNALRLDELAISFNVTGPNTKQVGNASFQVAVDDFVTVRTSLRNRSPNTIFPLLRLRPSLVDQPREIALDLGKRFAWGGVLQRVLPALGPGEETTVDLVVCALCSGEFEVGASVEEIKASEEPSKEVENGGDKVQVLDELVTGLGRRVWTAKEGCKIIAIR